MEPTELLRQILRMRTVNPPGEEAQVVELLESFLADAGLKTEVLTSPGGRASLVARVEGPSHRPALVLLSHSDVVPVEENRWTHDPFGGDLDEGHVWGRGALDMKSMIVMHAVAAAELARSEGTPGREVIVVMVADEEAGGTEGARWLVDEHPQRVGFGDQRPSPEVIGEGAYGLEGAFERPVVPVALGEKTAVWFDLVAEGDPGHGALPPERQALIAVAEAVGNIAGFGTPRVHPVMREQFAALASEASGPPAAILRTLASPAGSAAARVIAARVRKTGPLGLLLSDSVTPTQMNGGYKSNVVPSEGRASFDARLLPDTDVDSFVAAMEKKARTKGARIDNVVQKGRGPVSGKTPLLEVIQDVSRRSFPGALPTVSLSPGISDLRFFRARGATGYGWCPLVLTPDLLATIHGHDERIGVEDFKTAVAATVDVVARSAT